ncbi:hypothetical protein QE177_09000 [Arsenophonus sp. aPb]|uniref:Bbp16 family capsid cement protein n=1 Tax=Arsenophonus sp. aPb TaxID=3041619 RepID=UPI00246963B1|nr:hypothetical protein [Arsenophonus sp. aPb]WGL97359.1 hypothetical protein QE177_09000 [Arsenophonus sp. aPb]
MILDKETLFSLDQKVTASAESESIIDLSPIMGEFRDVGIGEPLTLFIQASETAAAADDVTVQFVLETARTKDFANPHVMFQSDAKPVAKLVAGERISAVIPAGSQSYMRLRYVVAKGSLTAGAFTAGINLTVDAHPIYHAVSQ